MIIKDESTAASNGTGGGGGGSVDATYANASIVSGVLTLDLSNNVRYFKVRLNGNITSWIWANAPATANTEITATVELTADGTGRSITTANGTTWYSGITPVPTSANNKIDVYQFTSTNAMANSIAAIIGQAAG